MQSSYRKRHSGTQNAHMGYNVLRIAHCLTLHLGATVNLEVCKKEPVSTCCSGGWWSPSQHDVSEAANNSLGFRVYVDQDMRYARGNIS